VLEAHCSPNAVTDTHPRDYEIDAYRNWTHRTVWVWSKSLGERKLYETDSRVISYWPQ